MARRISGPLEHADGTPLDPGTLRLVATRNNYSADGSTPVHTQSDATVEVGGAFSITANFGQYRALFQDASESGWSVLGAVQVAEGGSIPLGEIIEFTDTDLQTTFATDVATQTWVEANYSPGTPSSLAITSLDVGVGLGDTFLRVTHSGENIIGEPPRRALYHFDAHSASGRNRNRIIG